MTAHTKIKVACIMAGFAIGVFCVLITMAATR
jgi:hypothetical protein